MWLDHGYISSLVVVCNLGRGWHLEEFLWKLIQAYGHISCFKFISMSFMEKLIKISYLKLISVSFTVKFMDKLLWDEFLKLFIK